MLQKKCICDLSSFIYSFEGLWDVYSWACAIYKLNAYRILNRTSVICKNVFRWTVVFSTLTTVPQILSQSFMSVINWLFSTTIAPKLSKLENNGKTKVDVKVRQSSEHSFMHTVQHQWATDMLPVPHTEHTTERLHNLTQFKSLPPPAVEFSLVQWPMINHMTCMPTCCHTVCRWTDTLTVKQVHLCVLSVIQRLCTQSKALKSNSHCYVR